MLHASKQTAVIVFVLTKYETKLVNAITPKFQPSKSNTAISNDSAVPTWANTARRGRARIASGLTAAEL
ncbi:MAG: hypothetical protein WAK48_01270 [Candidatus Acidiferrum sp.]|jgi:hypothetical protein